MELKPLENPWIKKIRGLTVYLVMSVSINIFLITLVTYVGLSRGEEGRPSESSACYEVTTSNAKVLNQYFLLSFEELTRELADKTLLQDGYTKRDLALACLVNYHFFDIEKAISGTALQRRKMTFVHKEGKEGGEIFDVMVFPGLEDKDYQVIGSFIQHHRHPLTAEGLFHELKKKQDEPSLMEAFFATTEFYALFYALNDTSQEVKVSRQRLVNMLLEGNWPLVVDFRQHRNIGEFLKGYVKLGSSEAASVWISHAGEQLPRQLDDETLVSLVSAIKDNSLTSQLFLKKILCSVRSDSVRKSAGLKLYSFEGAVPSSYDQGEAMKKFLPTLFAEKEAPAEVQGPAAVRSQKMHTVQAGDSLWKIAKKYGITIEELREVNGLKNDGLKPNQLLKVSRPRQGVAGGT